jgi:RNA polymerase sigma-70 factor (ECF subfamily)
MAEATSDAFEPYRERLLIRALKIHQDWGISPRADLAPRALVEGALAQASRSRAAYKGTSPNDLVLWLDGQLESYVKGLWNDAVLRYRDMLEGYARVRWRAWGLPARRIDPADLVNDAWLKAVRSREAFRGGSEGEYVVWLQTILENHARDRFAHEHAQKRDADREASARDDVADSSRRIEQSLLCADQSTPSLRARRDELVGRVYAEINGLPSPKREVVAMILQGQTRAQIAAELELTVSTVQRLLAESLALLRQHLKDMEGGL